MQEGILFQAIASLWDELPDLVGEDWPAFAAQIAGLRQQMDAAPAREAVIRARVLHLFSQHEAAHARLVARLAALERRSPAERGLIDIVGSDAHVEAGQIVGSGAHVEAGQIAGHDIVVRETSALPAGVVRRYTDITCPRQVWLETARVPVVVRLTVAPPPLSDAIKELDLRQELPVRARIDAPGFDVLNAAEQEIAIVPNADSAPVVFDLKPRQAGPTSVTLDFFQAGNPVGTASVPVEITTHPVSADVAEAHPPQPMRVQPGAQPPDLMLYIGYERFQEQPALTFTLIQAGEVGRTFHPVALQGDPEAHAGRLYEHLTVLHRREDPTADKLLPGGMKPVRLLRQDVDRRLKQLGQNLWRDLIPEELKAIYAAERGAWRDRTLLIVSDEPHFPWELVWPYGDGWEDDAPWCIVLRLTRWLRRDFQGNGHEAPPTRLALRALACIAPTDAGLLAAQQERALLARLAAQHQIADLSPATPTWLAVMDLLEGAGYDWLHVAAHGDHYPASPDTDAAIWLQDFEALTPAALVGPAIEGHMRERRPAVVFNACHTAQQGWALARLGGWANRLVSNGCGLFLAPMWTVSDALALRFAKAFYAALLAGEAVGEAVRRARLAARREGDPTWLAYSVYAQPNARLEFAAQ